MAKKSKQEFKDYSGGVFLVVADHSEEFMLALRYAAIISRVCGGRLGILNVIETQDFMHWGNVEEKIRREQRETAEKFLWEMAGHVQDYGCELPAFYIAEGGVIESVTKVLQEDKAIKRLILATSAQTGNPGPLVSHFTGKAISTLDVPLLIIPGHLDAATLEEIV